MARSPLGRRAFTLEILGGLAAVAVAGRAGAAERAERAATCTLYPQQTEGPFYVDRRLLRRDITEGRRGTPLVLALRVVSASGCAPLAGRAVDVWHCDAAGLYSGHPGQLGGIATSGETFLRGTQITGEDGGVRFETIYPGWYPGRTTHVHFKVHLSRDAEAVSQLYFPEEVTRAVYSEPPYAGRGRKDTSNARDGVARFAGLPPLASVETADGGGLLASLTIAVAT